MTDTQKETQIHGQVTVLRKNKRRYPLTDFMTNAMLVNIQHLTVHIRIGMKQYPALLIDQFRINSFEERSHWFTGTPAYVCVNDKILELTIFPAPDNENYSLCIETENRP